MTFNLTEETSDVVNISSLFIMTFYLFVFVKERFYWLVYVSLICVIIHVISFAIGLGTKTITFSTKEKYENK